MSCRDFNKILKTITWKLHLFPFNLTQYFAAVCGKYAIGLLAVTILKDTNFFLGPIYSASS